jgi:hypothetical protein
MFYKYRENYYDNIFFQINNKEKKLGKELNVDEKQLLN